MQTLEAQDTRHAQLLKNAQTESVADRMFHQSLSPVTFGAQLRVDRAPIRTMPRINKSPIREITCPDDGLLHMELAAFW